MQTSTKAARSQWTNQRKQIAEDTQVTIDVSKTAIETALKEARKELATINGQINAQTEVLAKRRNEQEHIYAKVDAEIGDLEHTKKVLTQTNTELVAENRDLGSEIAVRRADVLALQRSTELAETTVSELEGKKNRLVSELEALQEGVETATADLQALKGEFAARQTEINREVSILEARKQALAQEIMDNQAQDEKVRDNLAVWSKSLDEKDRNLRIRESKVNEQEKSIARNYNLLNL